MAFEEKSTWICAVTAVVAYGVYLTIILLRAQDTPITEVHYVAPMLWTIGSGIVVSILGHIVAAIAWPKECNQRDQRDREIHRFGEYIGQPLTCVGGMATIGLSMAEVNHFWIANVVYLAFFLSTLLGSATKLVAYRRGFQSW